MWLAFWYLMLQPFNFIGVHSPGLQMVGAEMISHHEEQLDSSWAFIGQWGYVTGKGGGLAW